MSYGIDCLRGSFIEDYIRKYYRGYEGGVQYEEFRMWLIYLP